MNKTYITLMALALPMAAWAYTQPEQVRNQKAEYDEAAGVVVVSGELPTVAYDSEWYIYEDLDHISEVVLERHTPGQPWPDNAVIARVADQVPGAYFSYEDADVQPDAKYEYPITCYVDGVRGYSSYANVYTGVTPGQLEFFRASTSSPESTSIDFTITAPSLSVSGMPLTSLSAIEIEAYEMFTYHLIHTIENVTPGETYTWTLEGLQPNATYYFRGRVRKGETGYGESIETQTYVGLDIPGTPVEFSVAPQSNDEVLLTWQPAPAGLRGGSFNPDETTYRITRKLLDGETIEAGISAPGATSFVDSHGLSEEAWVEYILTPSNDAGECYKPAESEPVCVGAPATLPFTESFSYSSFDHKGWSRESTQDDPYYTYQAWGSYQNGTAYHWGTDQYIEITSQDEDLGFASCLFYSYSPEGQTEGLISPRITIGNVKDLELSFYYYDFDAESCGNIVTAAWRPENGEWTEVFRSVPEDDTIPGWNEVKLEFPVESSTGNIQMRIEGIRGGIPIVDVYVDNIRLAAKDLSGIENIAAGNADAEAEYYSVDGRRLNAAPESGLYILRQGNQVKKVLK